MNGYKIPVGHARVEDMISRSRFISSAGPASTPEEARAFIAAVGSDFPDASHHCYAFIAGPPGSTAHIAMSDDGEPSGTAGRPMLAVLLGSGLSEIVAVVTRYFGGTKLGTGGLVRAYSSGVRSVLGQLPLGVKLAARQLSVRTSYRYIAAVDRLLLEFQAQVIRRSYAADVCWELVVREDDAEALTDALTDAGRGHITAFVQRSGATTIIQTLTPPSGERGTT